VPIGSVCVYCGSSPGFDEVYARAARELGGLLASRGVRLVYGGGSVGLMGILADAVLEAGGEVVGVIPKGLFGREIAHDGLTELHEVASMHERKQLMFDLADAFVALPGGLGTLEELAEVTTWGQLGLHRKPIVLLDVNDFWAPLAAQLDRATAEGFLRPANRALLARVASVEALLPAIDAYDVPPVEKWIDESET
jgi:uncharacterized protein (TIGR00730 family)